MKTPFSSLAFPINSLLKLENLKNTKYAAIVQAVVHHFVDESEPDFSHFTDSKYMMAFYENIVKFIEYGINKTLEKQGKLKDDDTEYPIGGSSDALAATMQMLNRNRIKNG